MVRDSLNDLSSASTIVRPETRGTQPFHIVLVNIGFIGLHVVSQ